MIKFENFGNEEQTKSKSNWKPEIIQKNRSQINRIETMKQHKELLNARAAFFETINTTDRPLA